MYYIRRTKADYWTQWTGITSIMKGTQTTRKMIKIPPNQTIFETTIPETPVERTLPHN